MRTAHFSPCFVEFVPDELDQGRLYVSMEYAIVVHLCACGCGRKTVTPLSPTDWKLIFDGRNVSLLPSIGNWAYPCRSHYWIADGVVRWSPDMSDDNVADMRRRSRDDKAIYYGASSVAPKGDARDRTVPTEQAIAPRGLLAVLRTVLSRWRAWK